MAEPEVEETETTEDEGANAPEVPGVVHYLLRSVTRGRSNRTARAMQPGRRGFVQRFAGGFIVRRARPARITEAVLRANLEEIKKAVREHRIEVATTSGQLVDLETFSVAPPAAPKPLPNPPLDSAKNDPNENVGYNVPPNPSGTPLDAEMPEVLRRESVLDDSADEDLDEETDPPTVPASDKSPEAPPAPPKHQHTGKGKRGHK